MNPSSVLSSLPAEAARHAGQLSLAPGDNYPSKAVGDAYSSSAAIFPAEGYGRAGFELENAISRLCRSLFRTDYDVLAAAYSESIARLAGYSALLQPGDTVLALDPAHGGLVGSQLAARLYQFSYYGTDSQTHLLDYAAILQQARECRPRLIVAGGSAYPHHIDWAALGRIAREVGAWFLADIDAVSGLVAGGSYPSPFGWADVVVSGTSGTLRGPFGGLVCTRPEVTKAVKAALQPGLQDWTHPHLLAAQAVALEEASQPAFSAYIRQCLQNSQALAYSLQRRDLSLLGDGTDTHLMAVRSAGLPAAEAAALLQQAGLPVGLTSDNASVVLGVAAVTTRGLKEREMELLAECVSSVLTSRRVDPDLSHQVAALAKKFRIPAFP